MSNEIQVGEYIRNRYGIAKVVDISFDSLLGVNKLKLDNKIAFRVNKETGEIAELIDVLPLQSHIDISKINHSPNIIDLIEVRRLCKWSRN